MHRHLLRESSPVRIVARAKDDLSMLFLDEKGVENKMLISDFNKKYDICGVIRLTPEEFEFAKRNYKFTHFNLQASGHKEGKVYSLMHILRYGYFDGRMEKLPLLNITGMIVARCVYVKECIRYDELREEDFKNSIVSSVGELKELILKKYRKSMPHLSTQNILSLGIGITKLEDHKYISPHDK